MLAHGSDAELPVCLEPKLFVGQVPPSASEDDVLRVFNTYGPVEQINIPKNPRDGKSRGFAMLRYSKWAHAEAAIEAQNGKHTFGGDRALVVKLADPPKSSRDGVALGSQIGITPKKLFVGQISTATESDIRDLFEPYGKIVQLNILPSSKGAPCAFVKYDRWAEAEAAIEAVNGKVTLGASVAPLVVKFADGKLKRDNSMVGVGMKRGNDEGVWPGNKRINMGVAAAMGSNSFNIGMSSPYGMGMEQYSMMTTLNKHMGFDGAGMGLGHLASGSMMGGSLGGGAGMLSPSMAGLGGYDMGMGGLNRAKFDMDMNGAGAGMMGMGAGGINGLGQMGGMMGGMMGGGLGSQLSASAMQSPGMMMGSGMANAGMMGRLAGMGNLHLRNQLAASSGALGMMGASPSPQRLMGMGAALGQGHGPLGMGGGGNACPWKLFVGQVPFEATEHDLLPLFSQFGDIQSIMILRKPTTNQSKGCAFVTYATQQQALAAIDGINGKMCVPGDYRNKPLIVNLAAVKS